MAQQISRIPNRITLIFGVATAAATVFLLLVIPVVADLTPEAARSVRLHCLILGPLVMVGIIIALRLYLRPISDLGYALEIGSTPTVELTQNARKIALYAPFYFFVLPTAGSFVAGLIINVLGCLLWRNYVFGERLLAVLLSTAITACGALVVALICRRYMRPVLLYTAPRLQDVGFRLNIRARLIAATLTLITLALFFPGGYALTRVVDAYRQQLADRALAYLTDAVEAWSTITSL
jgi:hypothetical protein